jgi:predicted ArsR family transcriptional regulator
VLRGTTWSPAAAPSSCACSARAAGSCSPAVPTAADLLIGEIAQLVGHDALVALMRNLGTRMAAGLEQAPVSEARIVEHMNETGYAAQVLRAARASRNIAHNCVFHHLASAHPEVCELDLALIGTLGGGSVEHLECMVRGGQVCRFTCGGRPEPALPANGRP